MKRSRCLSLLNANVDVDVLLDTWEKHGIEEAARLLSNAISQGVAHADVMTSHVDATPAAVIRNSTKGLHKSSKKCHDIEESNILKVFNLDDISDAVILDGIDVD